MKLNHKVLGKDKSATPLMILHGLFGSLDNWQTLGNAFAEDRPVVLVDLRNHGRSPHAESHTYEDMVADVKELVNGLTFDKFHLMGHSMGGKVAMHYALRNAADLEKLISVDMGTQTYERGHDEIFKALQTLDLSKIEKRSDADKALAAYIGEFGIRQFLLKGLKRSPQGYEWRMNLDVIYKDYPSILAGLPQNLGQFSEPTLFVKGQKSAYIKPDKIQDYQKWFPKADLREIAGAGHWVHAEKPKDFFQSIQSFI